VLTDSFVIYSLLIFFVVDNVFTICFCFYWSCCELIVEHTYETTEGPFASITWNKETCFTILSVSDKRDLVKKNHLFRFCCCCCCCFCARISFFFSFVKVNTKFEQNVVFWHQGPNYQTQLIQLLCQLKMSRLFVCFWNSHQIGIFPCPEMRSL